MWKNFSGKTFALTQARVCQLLDYDPETGVFRWKATKAHRVRNGDIAGSVGRRDKRDYWIINIDYHPTAAHRLAWLYVHGESPAEIDHIDGDGLNNRLANLRPCTSAQNNANQRLSSRNTSGFKGVSWHAVRNRWRASIGYQGKQVHLGLFDTAEEAHAAYLGAATRLYGEFARAA